MALASSMHMHEGRRVPRGFPLLVRQSSHVNFRDQSALVNTT
jgi:hypothetical protein